jgi:hypothetical protein
MTTITTAAELDALPVGSVVRDHFGFVYARTRVAGWKEAGYTWEASSENIELPATLLTPDEPVATTVDGCGAVMFSGSICTRDAGHDGHHFHTDPWRTDPWHVGTSDRPVGRGPRFTQATTVDREAVARAWFAASATLAAQRFGCVEPVRWEECIPEEQEGERVKADAVLALLPATVKPDADALTELIDATAEEHESEHTLDHTAARCVTDAVLAAWPGRTEAEVMRHVANDVGGAIASSDFMDGEISPDGARWVAAEIREQAELIDGQHVHTWAGEPGADLECIRCPATHSVAAARIAREVGRADG